MSLNNYNDNMIYTTSTFRDPYLHPLYLRTNDAQSIYQQTMGDWLLDTYINKLNNDICDDLEIDQMTHNTLLQILTYTRVFGYCVICNYENGDGIRVYSENERTDWIKQKNPISNRIERIGITVNWTDDLSNAYNDNIIFNNDELIIYESDPNKNYTKGYLLIFEQGDGRIQPNSPSHTAFARGELTPALLGIAIQCRQILSTMSFGASHPFFYHLRYGDSIDPKQILKIESVMRNVSVSNGFGAKKSIVEEIIPIENSSVDKSILALDQLVSYYSGITRLPLSYYLGERSNGGLGDSGETNDDVNILMRKREIMAHLSQDINTIFLSLGLQQINVDLYASKIQEVQDKQQKKEQDQLTQDNQHKN